LGLVARELVGKVQVAMELVIVVARVGLVVAKVTGFVAKVPETVVAKGIVVAKLVVIEQVGIVAAKELVKEAVIVAKELVKEVAILVVGIHLDEKEGIVVAVQEGEIVVQEA